MTKAIRMLFWRLICQAQEIGIIIGVGALLALLVALGLSDGEV